MWHGGSTTLPYLWQASSGYVGRGDGPTNSPGYLKVGARYYDPVNGRFITRDTDLNQSPYAYCDGDPVNFTDPNGHSKLSTWWQKLLAAIGVGLTMGTGAANHAPGAGMEGRDVNPGASQQSWFAEWKWKRKR